MRLASFAAKNTKQKPDERQVRAFLREGCGEACVHRPPGGHALSLLSQACVAIADDLPLWDCMHRAAMARRRRQRPGRPAW